MYEECMVCEEGIGWNLEAAQGAAAAESQQNRPRREAESKSFLRKPRKEWVSREKGGRRG